MQELFPDIPKIPYEGKDSRNPLAFKHYNQEELVGSKTMREHLRFSLAYWHTFCGTGTDPFGHATMQRPWDALSPMQQAEQRVYALAEFTGKLGIPFFCFHDRDIAPEADTLRETNKRLDSIVRLISSVLKDTDLQLAWGTANLFSHPRYMHGAATSPDARVFAHAAAQVKKALEITRELGGKNYVFWGGREGYETLLNTCMRRELDNLAAFFHLAIEHAQKIGFTGQFLFEPKPMEPTRHQYDFDSAAVFAFLQKNDLLPYVKLNIETNHATLAGHSMQHELRYARINNILGSVDANQGDELVGWDTDHFPSNIYTTLFIMYEILKNGGIAPGCLNFDAKTRRPSYTPRDLFYAHILGMDAFARGLKAAHGLLESREIEDYCANRYASYTSSDVGQKITNRQTSLEELERFAMENPCPLPASGEQELLESIINRYV